MAEWDDDPAVKAAHGRLDEIEREEEAALKALGRAIRAWRNRQDGDDRG